MAVAFDAKTAAVTESSSATSLSASNLTVGSGANRALIVLVWHLTGSNPAGLTVTWDSGGSNQAMTLITGTQSASGSSSFATSMYGLIAPVSGNKTLRAAWTSALEGHIEAICFTGVNQTGGATSFANGAQTNPGASTTSTITITSAVGNMVVAGHCTGGTVSSTSDNLIAVSNALTLCPTGNYAAGAATKTLTATMTSSPYASMGCNVVAAAAGAAFLAAPNTAILQAVKRASYY